MVALEEIAKLPDIKLYSLFQTADYNVFVSFFFIALLHTGVSSGSMAAMV